MFIYCFDKSIEDQLIKDGFKVVEVKEDYTIFAYDPNLKFSFDDVGKDKLHFTKRLTF